jgi:hypothetical protein
MERVILLSAKIDIYSQTAKSIDNRFCQPTKITVIKILFLQEVGVEYE